jgi:hypothetical protein
MTAQGCVVAMRIAATVSVLLAPAARAQNIRIALVGAVRDSAGTPVVAAQVTAAGQVVIADSTGRFHFSALPIGQLIVHTRRLGFQPSDVQIELVDGRLDSLVVELHALPLNLPGVTTSAEEELRRRMPDFYRHKQSRNGRFFERRDIVASRVTRTSDLLRRLPGVRIATDRNGRSQLRMGRTGSGRDCPPDFYVDNVRTQGLNVDDIPPADIEAMEVYNGPSGLPPEYNNRFGNPGCGTVVIWTRLPG